MDLTMDWASDLRTADDKQLYSDEHDREVHRHVMDSLVAELEIPFQDLKARYEAILAELRQDAQIVDFLPVLVVKRLKQDWRRRTHGELHSA